MKKLLLICILLCLSLTNTQSQNLFQKYYGHYCCNTANAGLITNDGGYMMAGWWNNNSPPNWLYLVKTDVTGNLQWTTKFGAPNNDDITAINMIKTYGGGYAILGYTTGWGGGLNDFYFVKIDAAGNIISNRTYGFSSDEIGWDIKQTRDSGFIMTGETHASSSSDVIVVRTDADGNLLWCKTYGTVNYDEIGNSVVQTPDGGFLIAGSYDTGAPAMYFIRTDAAGDTLWTKKWGPVGPDGVKDMMLTADSGFVIIGETSWPNGAITVMRTDSALDTLWVKQYVHTGFSDLPHRINSTVDGGYIIAGTSYVGSSSAQDVLIIKIDSAGNYQWSKMYGDGGDSGEDAVSVEQATDGGFFIGGGRFGGSPYYYNPYLIKTDAQGLSGCFENNLKTLANSLPLVKGNTQTLVHLYIPTVTNPTPGLWYGGIEYDICSSTVGISEYELLSQINIYPNPFSENLIIEMKSAEPVELILYDVTSRRLIQQLFIKSTRINTGQLAQGIYLYEVRNQRGVIKTGKVIK